MRVPLITIAVKAEHDLVLVRQRARQLAGRLGLDETRQTRLATAVSEISRNAFQYAGEGKVEMLVDRGPGHLVVRVVDRGPGIRELDAVLSGSYHSETGLGLGLTGARRLVDHFEIESRAGRGTSVELGFDLPRDVVDDRELLSHVDSLARSSPGDPFSEVLQQNQELLRAQNELAEANRELEEAQEAKDRFLAMLAHELRNLLNALRSSMEVLKRRPEDRVRLRMEQVADLQIDHLARLINDLLDASRIIRGTLELRPERVDVVGELLSTLSAWRDRIETSERRLDVELPTDPVWATVDPTRLAQIVGNLLSNAGKFTDPGGRICLRLEVVDRRIRIHVEDDGCGMEGDQLRKVFEPFSQTLEARKRMTGGLGLGLAITKALVEAHGGELKAHSDGVGQGSTVTLELPVGEAPATVVPRRSASADTIRKCKVLLVDDHRASAEGLSELLRMDGHRVEIAEDGPSALDLADTFEPEVVLCDLGLPGMDGHEVARRLTGQPEPPRIIALTGFVDAESTTKALDSGFEEVLSKPVDVAELMRLLGSRS